MTKPVFDTHFHIIDPHFPVVENQGFPPPIFTVDLDLIRETLGDAHVDRAFWDNAAAFYRPRDLPVIV